MNLETCLKLKKFNTIVIKKKHENIQQSTFKVYLLVFWWNLFFFFIYIFQTWHGCPLISCSVQKESTTHESAPTATLRLLNYILEMASFVAHGIFVQPYWKCFLPLHHIFFTIMHFFLLCPAYFMIFTKIKLIRSYTEFMKIHAVSKILHCSYDDSSYFRVIKCFCIFMHFYPF